MRALFVLTPIALIGGFAAYQAVSGPEECAEKQNHVARVEPPAVVALPTVAAVPVPHAVPAVHALPAVAAVPAVPEAAHFAELAELSELAALAELSELSELSSLAELSEDIEIRIPREAIERARRIAEEFQLRAEGHAEIEVRLSEVMQLLDEHLSDLDGTTIESFEDLGLDEDFFANLAESIRASVRVAVDDGDRVTVRVPKRRKN